MTSVITARAFGTGSPLYRPHYPKRTISLLSFNIQIVEFYYLCCK